MEVTHELILGLTDIDRLSIKCKSCGAEFVVSLNLLSDANVTSESSTNRQIPTKCPSCPRDWSDVNKAVRDFGPTSLCAASLFVIAARQTFVRYHTMGYLVQVFTPEV